MRTVSETFVLVFLGGVGFEGPLVALTCQSTHLFFSLLIDLMVL